jgi:hypothetical protein
MKTPSQPMGNGLVSNDSDGPIRFWECLLLSRDLDAWRAEICGMVRRNLTRAEWRHYVGEDSHRETCPNTFKR